jgi:threonine dehydrogenase-like Zn-dependent dehydrogenase
MNSASLPATMMAAVLTGPFDAQVVEQPTPKIMDDGDVVVKVHLAGLCGESGRMR